MDDDKTPTVGHGNGCPEQPASADESPGLPDERDALRQDSLPNEADPLNVLLGTLAEEQAEMTHCMHETLMGAMADGKLTLEEWSRIMPYVEQQLKSARQADRFCRIVTQREDDQVRHAKIAASADPLTFPAKRRHTPR